MSQPQGAQEQGTQAGGFWKLFLPRLEAGTGDKYAITAADWDVLLKADPVARQTELSPATASLVPETDTCAWTDAAWMASRDSGAVPAPLSIYEVHAASWRRDEHNQPLDWPTLTEPSAISVPDLTAAGHALFATGEITMNQPNATIPAWGAWPVGQGQVRFALWAPAAKSVDVVFANGARSALQAGRDGFFSAVIDCAPDARYRYSVDGGAPVPDPASRWQPDGVHGPSAVQPTDGYLWQNTQWQGRPWDEAVIYELHVGTCGGYAGVQAQLPQLAAMGITAIELMPLSAFPGAHNWGYDGVLPYAPVQAYGTPDQLKALIDAAHGYGLMVLLDVVYNHFGPDGNYLHSYAAPFFYEDKPTPWGAAIDFRKLPVQRYFLDNALMWLHEYRFDGLRLDAVHAICPNAFLDTLRQTIHASLPTGRQVHLVLENEANQASQLQRGYTAQWDDDFHNALHVLLTGEEEGYYAAFADKPTQHLARVLGEGFAYQGEPDPRGHVRGEPSGALPPYKFVVFAQNHDQIGNRARGERLTVLVAPQRLRAALALTALTPMIPLFFMGEPWGAKQPFLFFTDFGPPLDEAVREGRRREFAHFAAFADHAQRATIPDPNSAATFAASRSPITDAAHAEGAHWVAWFTALLEVRRQWLVPGLAQARAVRASVLACGAVTATWQLPGGRWHIAFNVGTQAVPLPPVRGRVAHVENVAADAQELPVDGFIAWHEAQP